MMEQVNTLNVAIVGGGLGCKAVMEMIFAEKLSQLRMNLIGVACTNTKAVGYRYALEKGIFTTSDYRDLYKLKDLHMIIELTGHNEIANDISRGKPDNLQFMDHVAARLFWDVFQIEEQRIAERKRAATTIREGEAKSQLILQTMPSGLFTVDLNKTINTWNKWAEEITGLKAEEVIGRDCIEALDCDACKKGCALFDDKVGKPIYGKECALRVDGREIAILKNADVLRDSEGNTLGGLEIFVDISDRKRAEEALRRSRDELEQRVEERTYELTKANKALELEIEERKLAEEELRESKGRYRMVLEASPDPVVAYDMEGKVTYISPAFTRVFGWMPGELLGEKLDYVPDNNWRETQLMIDKVLAGENFSGVESRRYTKDGNILDVSISASIHLSRVGTPAGSVHTLRDITEDKRLKNQLQQAQKMEAIGTLAGGVAHDFNNLLTGILGNASLILMDIDSTHPYYRQLNNIQKQAQSGARLTSQILGYARKGGHEVKSFDLNKLVEETSIAFGRTRKEITIHREFAHDLFAIEADYVQIERVLLNLFVNAADAMSICADGTAGGPGSMDLILKTTNATSNDMKGKLYDPEPGNYALLTVTDTGTGMDTKTMERIFDPFFTTKEMGFGTGLGLASTYGIIKSHGGYIDVDSEKGRGTTFMIYLPAAENKVEKSVENTEQIVKGSGTILIVDDEKMIADISISMLERLGYTVLEARGGSAAVKIYKENNDKIDLVILDIIMPRMGGGEVYDNIKAINPNVKVLLTSGYDINGQARQILERGCNGFIQKPFDVKALAGKIREILDEE